jgi:hypothetical protein
VTVVVPDRSPERTDVAPFGHRQVDSQQRDGDGDDGIGKERQPVNGTRFVLQLPSDTSGYLLPTQILIPAGAAGRGARS